MSYRFFVEVPAENSVDATEFLYLQNAAVTLSPIAGVGAAGLDLPATDPKLARIMAALDGAPPKVQVYDGNTFEPDLSFYLEYLGKVTVAADGKTVQQFTGRFVGAILEDEIVPPNLDPAATEGYVPSGFNTAGAYARAVIDHLKVSGAFPNVVPTFTDTETTDGFLWGKTSKTEINIGDTVLTVLEQLASSAQWVYKVRDSEDGTIYLDAYNVGQEGRDLSATAIFMRGRDIGDSTREYRYEGTGTTLAVYSKTAGATNSDVLYVEVTDPAALARWRRGGKRGRKVIYETREDIFDKKTLIDYANAKLPSITAMTPQVEIRDISLLSGKQTPIPFRAFTTLDFVGVRADSGFERWQVQQITLNIAPGGVAVKFDLVLGLSFRDPRIPAPTSTTDPVGNPANPQVPDPTDDGSGPDILPDPSTETQTPFQVWTVGADGQPGWSNTLDITGNARLGSQDLTGTYIDLDMMNGAINVSDSGSNAHYGADHAVVSDLRCGMFQPGYVRSGGGVGNNDYWAAPDTAGAANSAGGTDANNTQLVVTIDDEPVDIIPLLRDFVYPVEAPPTYTDPSTGTSTSGLPAVQASGTLTTEAQFRNAFNILWTCVQRNVGKKGATMALMTAMVESNVKIMASNAVPESLNYPHDGVAAGDADSVGLFQQRAPWAPVASRMASTMSTQLFLLGGSNGTRGLTDIPGWDQVTTAEEYGDMCQAVQVSAYPERYAPHFTEAKAFVDQWWSTWLTTDKPYSDGTTPTTPGGGGQQ